MSIYLKIDSISGDATDKGHEGWIKLQSVNIGTSRATDMNVGNIKSSVTSSTKFSDLQISKEADKASPLLFSYAHSSKVIPKLTIDFCLSTTTPAYAQYILSDVVISNYHDHADAGHKAIELISLSYKKIEKS